MRILTGLLGAALAALLGAGAVLAQTYPSPHFNSLTLDGRIVAQSGDVRNVLDFGAKCDGATTDTTAFQGAINAAAGHARVYVPNTGAACMVGNLSVPSNTDLVIDGTLKLAAGSNTDLIDIASGATNVLIEGAGTLDGNKTNQTAGTSAGIGNLGSPSYIWIRGLTITNVRNWPVNLVNVTHAWMRELILTNSGNSVEYAANSSDCWADHLYISTISDEGFAFYGGPHDCGITNSTATAATASGISVLNDAGQLSASHDLLIGGNFLYGNGLSGVELNRGTGATALHYNIIVANNRIFGNATTNPGGVGGINASYGSNLTISDNEISKDGSGSGSAIGIILGSNVSGASVTGNLIFDEGQGGTNGVGISDASAPNVLISGNTIYDDQTTKTMAFALNGSAGSATHILANHLGATIGAADNLTAAADTVKAEAPSASAAYAIYGGANVSGGNLNVNGSANNISLLGSGAGSAVAVQATGTDTNINLTLNSKGTGTVTANGLLLAAAGETVAGGNLNVVGSANNLGLSGSGSGSPTVLQAFGSDTNIGITVAPKGTGVVTFNGSGGVSVAGGLLAATTANVTAAGTTQATATALTTQFSAITGGTGGVLLPSTTGAPITIANRTGATVSVYPPVGAQIDANAVNAAVSVASAGIYHVICVSAAQCWSD